MLGILTPQSLTHFSRLESISEIMLKHIGEDIPPYLTPFCIQKGRDSLYLICSLLDPSCYSSASIATVSGFHPSYNKVSYSY